MFVYVVINHLVNFPEDNLAEGLWWSLKSNALVFTAVLEHCIDIRFSVFLLIELASLHSFHLIQSPQVFNFSNVLSSITKLYEDAKCLHLDFSDNVFLLSSLVMFDGFNSLEGLNPKVI